MVPFNPASLLGKPVIQVVGDLLTLGTHVRVVEQDGVPVVSKETQKGKFVDVKVVRGIVVEVRMPEETSRQLLSE